MSSPATRASGIVCPRCSASLPPKAAFCHHCGADVRSVASAAAASSAVRQAVNARAGFVAAGRGMPVCHGCGALAPAERTSCESCGKPIGTSLEAVPRREDDLSFVQMRVELTCRQCGARMPLDEPELDDAVSCPRCDTMQAFDLDAWAEAFSHAHVVADAYGPRGEMFRRTLGTSDPYPALGRSTAVAELRLTGVRTTNGVVRTRNLRSLCAPGQPLCDRCGSPTEPGAESSADTLIMRCVNCSASARYIVPPLARRLAPSLVGFVAEALRIDRPEARLDATSAGFVVALRCPACGGALNVTPGSHVAVCAFCKTESRIASRTLLALKSADTEPRPFWAVFRGDAPARARLAHITSARGALATPASDTDLDARLLALVTMAEAPDGAKAVQSAVESKVGRAPVDMTPEEKRREWALQLGIPCVALLAVSPFFLPQFLSLFTHGTSSPPVTLLAGTPEGDIIAPAPGVPLVLIVDRDGRRLPVCDDDFDWMDAIVACRQLGLSRPHSHSSVPGWTDDFWLDNLSCAGTEARLDDCHHAGFGNENCNRFETVSVTCE